MWSKKTSGMIGMVVGGAMFAMNVRHFAQQGFVAIGLPLVLMGRGAYFYFSYREEE